MQCKLPAEFRHFCKFGCIYWDKTLSHYRCKTANKLGCVAPCYKNEKEKGLGVKSNAKLQVLPKEDPSRVQMYLRWNLLCSVQDTRSTQVHYCTRSNSEDKSRESRCSETGEDLGGDVNRRMK